MHDPLFFNRPEYADKLVNSLKDGITHAFTLFAPRRMGKTQFLLQDIAPLAKERGFNVFYFSFMDSESPAADFQAALVQFARDIQTGGAAKTFISSISKVEVLGVGLERSKAAADQPRLSDIISLIAADNRPSLLLLDEVQELARLKDTAQLIKSLRTGLDIHQNRVKTIFTGSSTNGLAAMFNDHKAPFFHFAHALDFPLLDRAFTDFLAAVYQQRTGKHLDGEALYQLFERLNHTPMYMRAVMQDMILNPALGLDEAAAYRISEISSQYSGAKQWQQLKPLERALIGDIAQNSAISPYSQDSRRRYAALLGVENIGSSSIQSALKSMTRQDLISRDAKGSLIISNPLLKTWILEQEKAD